MKKQPICLVTEASKEYINETNYSIIIRRIISTNGKIIKTFNNNDQCIVLSHLENIVMVELSYQLHQRGDGTYYYPARFYMQGDYIVEVEVGVSYISEIPFILSTKFIEDYLLGEPPDTSKETKN